jgi:NYN domain
VKGALLIDWENLVYDLYEHDYYYPVDELARRLRAKATLHCKDQFNVNLTYRGVFAPAKAFIPSEVAALVDSGFEVVNTLGGKNAADLELAIKAVRLLLQQDYTHFIIVTGDVDYLALAWAIAQDNHVCYLWPVALQKVSRAVRAYDFVEYVPRLLELERGSPPTANEARLFLLLSHRLIDEGSHLGSIQRAKEELVKLGALSEGQINRAWVQHQDYFAKSPVRLNGRATVDRRRPAYEDPEVHRTYSAADMIIEATARRDRGGAREGELLEAIGEVLADRQDRIEFIETLVEAGYLRRAGDRYKLPSQIARYGIVRALYRLVTILWTVSTERGWEVVPKRFVREKWERQFKPGGNLNQDEKELAHEQATQILRRGEHACLIEARADGPHHGYGVIWDHAIARTVESAVATAVRTLAALDHVGTRIDQDVVIKELTARFVNEAEARFWLGALAATSHALWFQGGIQLRRSRLVRAILDGAAR